MFQPRKDVVLNILSASKAYGIIQDDSEFSEVVDPDVSFSQVQDRTAILSIILQKQQNKY